MRTSFFLPGYNVETEKAGLRFVKRYEQTQGRTVTDISSRGFSTPTMRAEVREWMQRRGKVHWPLACDYLSRTTDGTISRLIEVKGCGGHSTSVKLKDRQKAAAEALPEDWWLYVVFDCKTENPRLVMLNDAGRLPWQRGTLPKSLPDGTYRRVQDEGDWLVMPDDILSIGETHLKCEY